MTDERTERRARQSRRTMLTVIAIVVLALAVLAYTATGKILWGLIVVAILVVILVAAWILTARVDRQVARGRMSPVQQARAQLDVELVHAARAEHGESAGITEVRRQLPSLSFDEAVALHRYV